MKVGDKVKTLVEIRIGDTIVPADTEGIIKEMLTSNPTNQYTVFVLPIRLGNNTWAYKESELEVLS